MDLARADKKKARMRDYLIFTGLSLAVTVVLYVFDIPIWQAARDLVEPNFLFFPEWLSDWGLYIFYISFGGIFIYGLTKKKSNLIKIGIAYVKAQLIFSLLAVRLLKILVGRPRPGKGFDYQFLATGGSHNSFPSGHSADALVGGIFLFYLLHQSKYAHYRFLPLIYAFLIAVSRVFVSAHYPSDVAAGMAIGIMGAWFFISRLPGRYP